MVNENIVLIDIKSLARDINSWEMTVISIGSYKYLTYDLIP